MNVNGKSPDFDRLIASAGIKKLRVDLPVIGGKVVIRVMKKSTIIEKEEVKRNESVDRAAKRVYNRLKKERIVD